jgi:hypothetical protein
MSAHSDWRAVASRARSPEGERLVPGARLGPPRLSSQRHGLVLDAVFRPASPASVAVKANTPAKQPWLDTLPGLSTFFTVGGARLVALVLNSLA